MKKLLIALAAVLATVAAHAQGTVSFNTRITGVVDAPVTFGDANGAGVGDTWTGELWVQGAGGTLTLAPQSKTTFRTVPPGGNAALAKYVNTVSSVDLPGTSTGGSATVVFRAYKTSAGSFDAADQFSRGQSAPLVVNGLGGGPVTPANLVGLQGFFIPVVPEPSTIALGALGAVALLLRRRK